MKRILYSLALFFALSGVAYAEFPRVIDGQFYPPKVRQPVTEGVYIATITCSNTSTHLFPVVISTMPVIVHTVDISSAGVASSGVQLFDSQLSTTNQRPLTPQLQGSVVGNHVYDVVGSSGLTLSNFSSAGVAPCIGVYYTFR